MGSNPTATASQLQKYEGRFHQEPALRRLRSQFDTTEACASDEEAHDLDLEDGQPVIHIKHIAWDAEDRPVEVALHVMPAHLWRLRYDWDDPANEEVPDSAAPVF